MISLHNYLLFHSINCNLQLSKKKIWQHSLLIYQPNKRITINSILLLKYYTVFMAVLVPALSPQCYSSLNKKYYKKGQIISYLYREFFRKHKQKMAFSVRQAGITGGRGQRLQIPYNMKELRSQNDIHPVFHFLLNCQ